MTIRTYDSNYLSKASRALGAMLHDAVYQFGMDGGTFLDLFIQSGVAEAFENGNAKDMNDDNGSASAIVPIRVMNTRGYRLPKTGDAGTTLLAAGGMTLAVLSAAAVALLLVFKKKDKFDD